MRLFGLMDHHQAECLFAVESGSRAWGFPSANSDYDIRFVYSKHRDWYLSIENHRDVIEEMGDDDLDFSGWDLRKALQLAHKSNPSLHDWLATSDYYHRGHHFEEFRSLCLEYFDPHACYLHFRSMAKRNFEGLADADDLPFKKYFYVFRPLLCAKKIALTHQPAPCLFRDLLDDFYPSGSVRTEIEHLLELKRNGTETGRVGRNKVLHQEIGRLFSDTTLIPPKRLAKSADRLNEFFRKVVLSETP